jgi:hypothetical protein
MSPLLQTARIWIATGLLLGSLSVAGQGPAITVDFAPRVSGELKRYGEEEGTVLRTAILTAVSRELGQVAAPSGLAITVVVQDLAPTHPTRNQLTDDPATDVARTKFIGGAELTGTVRDAGGRVLSTVHYRHFPPNLELGSASLDPWADARLAIDQFAARLAVACRELPRGGN